MVRADGGRKASPGRYFGGFSAGFFAALRRAILRFKASARRCSRPVLGGGRLLISGIDRLGARS